VCFVFIHESRRRTPVEIVLRRGEGKETDSARERISPRYFVNTYVNTAMHPSVQLL
jgi:hypothetical protein